MVKVASYSGAGGAGGGASRGRGAGRRRADEDEDEDGGGGGGGDDDDDDDEEEGGAAAEAYDAYAGAGAGAGAGEKGTRRRHWPEFTLVFTYVPPADSAAAAMADSSPASSASASSSSSSSSSSSAASNIAVPRAPQVPRTKHELADCGFFALTRYEDGISVPLKFEDDEEVPWGAPEWDVKGALRCAARARPRAHTLVARRAAAAVAARPARHHPLTVLYSRSLSLAPQQPRRRRSRTTWS